MANSTLLENVRDDLRLLYRRGANQNRATFAMQGFDLVRQGAPFRILGHVDQILVVKPTVLAIRRYRSHLKPVDLQQLLRFGGSCTSHSAQPVVEPEVILERYRGVSASLLTHPQLFLGFDCLVQAIGEPPALH